jgi:hypothetical protein
VKDFNRSKETSEILQQTFSGNDSFVSEENVHKKQDLVPEINSSWASQSEE